MYRIISASKDTYITNRIINNKFRATDANVGQAGTLDLYKLYAESISGSDTTPTELSRILIKFDIGEVTKMQNSGEIDIADSSFKARVILHDVYGGQTTPNNFDVILFPLAKNFDEGSGYDIASFTDLDSTNYVTASVASGIATAWEVPGANKSGSLGDADIDVIVSGTIPGQGSAISLSPHQRFVTGEEDLDIDVTSIVSASVKGHISDKGFLIALSGAYEKDSRSYFVKRFASRNSASTAIRPKLVIQFDDSLQDNHEDFIFGVSGSLYLNNYHQGQLANIVSGLSSTELVGDDVMKLKLVTGSYKKIVDVSQAFRGTNANRLTGIYTASFAINQFETGDVNGDNLRQHIDASGSITFDEIWSSADETITYLSSSITVRPPDRSALYFNERRILATVLNLKDRYRQDEKVKIRVFAENANRDVVFVKSPLEKKSEIFHEMYYRVKDFQDGRVIVPFDYTTNSTKLSSDSQGMYFDFFMDSLPRGRTYVFEFLIRLNNIDTVIADAASKFIVE